MILNSYELHTKTMLQIPVHVYHAIERGPSLLLSAGMHGEETNGIEIIRKIVSRSEVQDIKRGTLIAIPVINVVSFLYGSRDLPDGIELEIERLTPSLFPILSYNLEGGDPATLYDVARYQTVLSRALEVAAREQQESGQKDPAEYQRQLRSRDERRRDRDALPLRRVGRVEDEDLRAAEAAHVELPIHHQNLRRCVRVHIHRAACRLRAKAQPVSGAKAHEIGRAHV